jgi:ABC-type multidrug transport system permease subunit
VIDRPEPSSTRRHPLLSLIAARVREFCREPTAIFWVYVFPLILVVALGVAFRNKPVGDFTVAVCDRDRGEPVRQTLEQDGRFRVWVGAEQESRERLRTGRADLVIVPSSDDAGGYAYYYDPTQANSVLARHVADDVLQQAAARRDAVAVQDHPLTEPGGRYIDFLVPGLLGMGLLGGGMWGVGFAIVDMRLRKLLKRYLATPMKRSHFLAAVMASRLLFTIPEVLTVLVCARLFFGVTSQGGYGTLGLLILLGAFQFSGIGLLVASRAQTIETVSGLMNAVMLPMWIGSGIFFSTERFPDVVQPVLSILPLTPLIHALRSVMLEGASLVSLGPQLALIVAWGSVTFILALRCFRWN